MYKEFIDFCKNKYPEFKEVFEKESISPNLFSFQTVSIKQSTYNKIQKFIEIAYQLRNHPSYQKDILGTTAIHPNLSVLMSFDFHLVDEDPKLIEINTNASHFLTSKLMESFLCEKEGRESSFPDAIKNLKESFLNEWILFTKSNRDLKNITIIDEDPSSQKAYFEFLLYKKFFENMGLEVVIDDTSDLSWNSSELLNSQNQKVDFVYNRSTDFYFKKPTSQNLKQAYERKIACISPQPQEYRLLAEKERLLDFGTPGFLEKYLNEAQLKTFRDTILKVFEVTTENKDETWKNRKKYFFKPKNSYGGKGVYKGESITHKVFDQIIESNNYIAQEFAPPSITKITDQVNHNASAKTDFRFFVYNGIIQHATARTYIGQITNFRTLGGGFAAIKCI